MPNDVRDDDRYRHPVEGDGCETTVDRTQDLEHTRKFVDCHGHQMEKAA